MGDSARRPLPPDRIVKKGIRFEVNQQTFPKLLQKGGYRNISDDKTVIYY